MAGFVEEEGDIDGSSMATGAQWRDLSRRMATSTADPWRQELNGGIFR